MNATVRELALDHLHKKVAHEPPQSMLDIFEAHPYEAARLYQQIKKHNRKLGAGVEIKIIRPGC